MHCTLIDSCTERNVHRHSEASGYAHTYRFAPTATLVAADVHAADAIL